MGQKERLKGTKTEQNLINAFRGESEARNKYTYFASKARKDGYEQISRIFEETAGNEKEHAKLWFKLINEIGTTEENLEIAIESERYEATIMYPDFAKEARAEGFDDIADMFEKISKIEQAHHDRYAKVLKNLKSKEVFCSETEVEWHCLNCGYIHKGKTAPEICPACKHEQSYFERYCKNY